jgi:hypothetical protein
MLILVSNAVFASVCTPLVAILFSASAQLVSSDLSCHDGGGVEEAAEEAAVERESAERESDRDEQNKRNRQTQIRHPPPRKR